MIGALLSVLLTATGNPFLQEAKEHFQALDFEKCLARLGQASTQWRSTKDELRDIELFGGLCHLSLGHQKDAAEHFRTALRIDEAADLPSWTSPKAVTLFLEVKRSLQAPPSPLPDQDLPPDAPRRATLEPSVKPAAADTTPGLLERHPVSVPLGLGAGVAAIVGVGLGVNARNLSIQANEARTDLEFGQKADAARANATGATVVWIVAGAAAASALVAFLLE